MKKLLSLLVLVLLVVPSMVFAEDAPNILKGNITVKRTCYQNIHEYYEFYSILQITDVTYNSDGKVDKFNFYALNDSVTSILANVKDSNGNPAFYIAPIDGPGPIYVRVLSTDFDPVALAKELIAKEAYSSRYLNVMYSQSAEFDCPFGYIIITSSSDTEPSVMPFLDDLTFKPKYVASSFNLVFDNDPLNSEEYQAQINEVIPHTITVNNLKNKTSEMIVIYLGYEEIIDKKVEMYLVKEDGTKELLDNSKFINALTEEDINITFNKDFTTKIDASDKVEIKFNAKLLTELNTRFSTAVSLYTGSNNYHQLEIKRIYYSDHRIYFANEEVNPVVFKGTFKILDKDNNDITKIITGNDTIEVNDYFFDVVGLKPGKYILKTVENNSGYNIPNNVEFEVLNQYYSENFITLSRSGIVDLPLTGGTGTTLLISLGSIFTILAIALLITKYKFVKEN